MSKCIPSVKVAALAAAITVGGLSASSEAAILVTEFLPNPSGTDTLGEWFEIYNAGDLPVDVSNYKVGDEEADPAVSGSPGGEGMFQFPAGTIMAPGDVWVIAVDATGFNALYGFNPTFEANVDSDPTVPNLTRYESWATGNLAIANTTDQVLILNGSDVVLDGANHGGSFFYEAPVLGANESYERVPANQDTDTLDDWIVRADGEATPGVITIPEPAGLAVLGLAGMGLIARRRRN